jgi:hypothetical protein
VSFRDIKSWVAGVRDDKDEETACDAIYEPQAAQGGEEAESAAGAQAQLLQESPGGKPRGIFCWEVVCACATRSFSACVSVRNLNLGGGLCVLEVVCALCG